VSAIHYLLSWFRKTPTDCIFLSYRRAHSAGHAGRLYDRLRPVFGSDRIFIDVDRIEGGDNFEIALGRALLSTKVALVLIGHGWANAFDNRSNNNGKAIDYVRMEVEEIVQSKIVAVPILLDGAQLPRSDEIPLAVRGILTRNALPLNHVSFDQDSHRIIETVRSHLLEPKKRGENDPEQPASLFGREAQGRDTDALASSKIPIIQSANFKGGTSKTFTIVNLGLAFSVGLHKRTLLVDLDPQATLTQVLLRQNESSDWNSASALLIRREATANDFLEALDSIELGWSAHNGPKHLRLSGGGLKLAHGEAENDRGWQHSKAIDPRFNVARILRHPSVQEQFDLVLIDSPSSYSIVSQAASVAATHYYIPAHLDSFGLGQVKLALMHNEDLARHLKSAPKFVGVVEINGRGKKERLPAELSKRSFEVPWLRLGDHDLLVYLDDPKARHVFDSLASELLKACEPGA
jgi:cellulose biosynthesis protein BcsQ